MQTRSCVMQSRSAVLYEPSCAMQTRSGALQEPVGIVQERSCVMQERSRVTQTRSAVMHEAVCVARERIGALQSRSRAGRYVPYPVYESSCSIFESTQSNSPLVILAPQCSHSPAMLTSSEAPQLGQVLSALGAPWTPAPRISVQYSE
jgi:hypothetical protein